MLICFITGGQLRGFGQASYILPGNTFKWSNSYRNVFISFGSIEVYLESKICAKRVNSIFLEQAFFPKVLVYRKKKNGESQKLFPFETKRRQFTKCTNGPFLRRHSFPVSSFACGTPLMVYRKIAQWAYEIGSTSYQPRGKHVASTLMRHCITSCAQWEIGGLFFGCRVSRSQFQDE